MQVVGQRPGGHCAGTFGIAHPLEQNGKFAVAGAWSGSRSKQIVNDCFHPLLLWPSSNTPRLYHAMELEVHRDGPIETVRASAYFCHGTRLRLPSPSLTSGASRHPFNSVIVCFLFVSRIRIVACGRGRGSSIMALSASMVEVPGPHGLYFIDLLRVFLRLFVSQGRRDGGPHAVCGP